MASNAALAAQQMSAMQGEELNAIIDDQKTQSIKLLCNCCDQASLTQASHVK